MTGCLQHVQRSYSLNSTIFQNMFSTRCMITYWSSWPSISKLTLKNPIFTGYEKNSGQSSIFHLMQQYRLYFCFFSVFLLFSSLTVKKERGLDIRRIEHDSDSSSHSVWWQVRWELRSHCSTVAVWSGDLTPDNSDLRSLLVSWAGCQTKQNK